MPHAPPEQACQQAPLADSPADNAEHSSDYLQRAAARNFSALALYQIVMRTGWIFKTESIIMPAVVDYISGVGWIRGCLPLLNRFGNSIPPVLLARRIKLQPKKKWAFFASTASMAGLFLLLTWLFWMGFAERKTTWMPFAFLTIYAAFFMCIGVNQLSFQTLQGKLVEVTRRGRLLQVSNTLGAITAITCAMLLLPSWLSADKPRFDLIFGFSGLLFVAAALASMLLVESTDAFEEKAAANPWQYFSDAFQVLSDDANFRCLSIVAALFGVSFMLFPHYQNLGLRGMRLELSSLMWWVVIQNIGTGLFSIPIGSIADRYGNRLVLRITLLGIVAAPIFSILLLHAGELGVRWYHSVFILVGLTPVVLRTLQNYALEICSPEDHPRYLSTLSLCMAAPVFLSPLVGYCTDLLGFEVVFLVVAGLILWGWLLTFRLQEPRHASHATVVENLD